MSTMNLTPYRRTITARKTLTQKTRKLLDAYRNIASQDQDRMAVVLLLEAEANVQRLLAMESGGAYGNLQATAQSVMTEWKTGRPAHRAWSRADVAP